MSDVQHAAPGIQPGAAPVPQGGVFAISEVMPFIQRAAAELADKREAWKGARDAKDAAHARARKVRADLMVTLRILGNDATGAPIRTAVERNEWADADPTVQQAELDRDVAQTAAMASYEAYQDAQASFSLLQSYLGMERDSLRSERHGG